MALQCPRCELRFDLAPMMADHLATDHRLTPEELVHLQPPSVRVGQAPSGTGRRTPADGGAPPPRSS